MDVGADGQTQCDFALARVREAPLEYLRAVDGSWLGMSPCAAISALRFPWGYRNRCVDVAEDNSARGAQFLKLCVVCVDPQLASRSKLYYACAFS